MEEKKTQTKCSLMSCKKDTNERRVIGEINAIADEFEFFQENTGKSRDDPHISLTSTICRMASNSVSEIRVLLL